MRKTISALALLAALGFAGSAQAQSLQNAGLSNIGIGSGASLGNSTLGGSSSISGSRINATTTSTSTIGNGVNQNPAGNGGIGGVATGFAETTALNAGAGAYNSQNLSGNGRIDGSFSVQGANGLQSTTGHPQGGSSATITGAGTLTGNLSRGSSSYANTGLNGYSGAQMSGGPGTVTNTISGSAFGAGGALSGGAGATGAR